jgi:hypothetical protein
MIDSARPSGGPFLPVVFLALWLFAIFVSVFDAYLALAHRETLATGELNPLGRALIALNGGQVWYLLAAKLVGTVIVGSLLLHIHDRYPRYSLPIVGAVAAAQMGLLLFLLLV